MSILRIKDSNGNIIDVPALRGPRGKDGITPHIGENGNWWIGTTDTGVFAGGGSGGNSNIIISADIPDYVKVAAQEVINKVRAVQTDNSIVFLAMSDSHHYGKQGEAGVDSDIDANGVQNNDSNLHAAMAAKILAYALKFDFMAHLGDAAWGHSTTHSELLQSQIKELFDWIGEADTGIPRFRAIGNHDTGTYYHEAGGSIETPEYLYNTFTALSASDDTVFGDTTYGGYCYRDFSDKKLRVFLLNTNEGILSSAITGTESAPCSNAQRLWIANALYALNGKSDAAEWSVVFLSHYPADYGSTMPLSDLIKAYVEGGSITIDGTTVNFSGRNVAKFVAQFHGHIHNFLVTKLSTGTTPDTVAQYDALRVCIPNAQYNRENYYDEKEYPSDKPYYYIPLKEDNTYPKTPNTANDTSFVVNVINPSEKKIYSFCYGAGYDRVIGYAGISYYSVSHTLSNVTIDNEALSAEEGKPYTATLTIKDGCTMSRIIVTMGGVNITSSVYNDGVISIPSVTGNISITATAATYTNLVTMATVPVAKGELMSTEIYNGGLGYKNGTRITGLSDVDNAEYVATGFVPFAKKADGSFPVLYVKGATLDTSLRYVYCTLIQTNSDTDLTIRLHKALENDPTAWEQVFDIETLGTNYYKLTVKDTAELSGFTCAFRMSLYGVGDNLVITADEPIN